MARRAAADRRSLNRRQRAPPHAWALLSQARHPPHGVINERLIKDAIDEERALVEGERAAAADAAGSSAAQMSAKDLEAQLGEQAHAARCAARRGRRTVVAIDRACRPSLDASQAATRCGRT